MDELFELLPGLLKTFPDSEQVRESVVFALFRRAAGKGLLDHAVPYELSSKKLTVAVADAVWERHMRSLAPGLIRRINKMAGLRAVKFIDFQVDETLFADRSGKGNSKKASPHKVPDDLKRKAALIADDELRRVFLESAGAYLAARDKRNPNSQD